MPFAGLLRSAFVGSLVFVMCAFSSSSAAPPLKVGVIGLTHTHVHWLLGRPARGDIEIAGIVESNQQLAARYVEQHGLARELIYPSMDELVAAQKVTAVTAFGSTFQHLEVVEFFAPRGIHVMVEKPLAVNLEHASKMAQLARRHGIHLLTNYETSWYATNQRAFEVVREEDSLGQLRKVVVHMGHRGPKEIGVNQEFLDWLTDPRLNGGGAVTDFGCYGSNLVNWLTNNRRPQSVTAILQQFKPDVYPQVDDEATILLEYDEFQTIIQASWNWPVSRKDMEVYGTRGQLTCHDRHRLTFRMAGEKQATERILGDRQPPFDDPFAYFAAVVNGQVKPSPSDPSALQNNLLVMEVLDAAIRSAKERQTIDLAPRHP